MHYRFHAHGRQHWKDGSIKQNGTKSLKLELYYIILVRLEQFTQPETTVYIVDMG